MRPRLLSVICLHMLRLSSDSEWTSCTKAWLSQVSVRLKQPIMLSASRLGTPWMTSRSERRRLSTCTRRMPRRTRLGNKDGLARRRCSLASTPRQTDLW
uniref:Putative secreted protein n=1 Tax=Ixodes ricinus TaxID=34613 RepID=A0A6B0UFJ3_IXORI